MKCIKCGRDIPKSADFCPHCGKRVIRVDQNTEPRQPAKCWGVFNNVGYGLSIAGLALFWFPILGWCFSIPGFVFACLGKRDEVNRAKQQKSFRMGLAGIILNFIALLVLVIVLPIVLSQTK